VIIDLRSSNFRWLQLSLFLSMSLSLSSVNITPCEFWLQLSHPTLHTHWLHSKRSDRTIACLASFLRAWLSNALFGSTGKELHCIRLRSRQCVARGSNHPTSSKYLSFKGFVSENSLHPTQLDSPVPSSSFISHSNQPSIPVHHE